MIIRKKGEKLKYEFLNKACLGRECFQPGQFQHRGATMSGSRSTGDYSACCMRRAYRGCPDGPEGQHVKDCEQCNGQGGGTCMWCLGTGHYLVVGVPESKPELVKLRKSEGWR